MREPPRLELPRVPEQRSRGTDRGPVPRLNAEPVE